MLAGPVETQTAVGLAFGVLWLVARSNPALYPTVVFLKYSDIKFVTTTIMEGLSFSLLFTDMIDILSSSHMFLTNTTHCNGEAHWKQKVLKVIFKK